jgi:hypothetical protein
MRPCARALRAKWGAARALRIPPSHHSYAAVRKSAKNPSLLKSAKRISADPAEQILYSPFMLFILTLFRLNSLLPCVLVLVSSLQLTTLQQLLAHASSMACTFYPITVSEQICLPNTMKKQLFSIIFLIIKKNYYTCKMAISLR